MSQSPRIALFGGSFDPVHLGHLQVAEAARKALALDQVIFIPCRQSPHKDQGPIASDQQRLHMLRLALADRPWAEVSDIEMHRPPPSFSWMTAEAMQQTHPQARLFWIMGADQWAVIQSWARPAYLATLVEFIVHDRGDPPAPIPGFRAHFITGSHPASATTIRKEAPHALPSHWIPKNVERYIRSRGLYGCGS